MFFERSPRVIWTLPAFGVIDCVERSRWQIEDNKLTKSIMNNYIKEHLLPGEQVVYETRLHWIMFAGPAVLLLFILLFTLANSALVIFWVLLAAIVVGWLLLRRKYSEFGITNKRVVIKTGIIRRRSLELLLTKIEGVTVDQNIVGRMFNYGTIVIGGVGGTKEPFAQIENPFEFRKRVHEQIGQ